MGLVVLAGGAPAGEGELLIPTLAQELGVQKLRPIVGVQADRGHGESLADAVEGTLDPAHRLAAHRATPGPHRAHLDDGEGGEKAALGTIPAVLHQIGLVGPDPQNARLPFVRDHPSPWSSTGFDVYASTGFDTHYQLCPAPLSGGTQCTPGAWSPVSLSHLDPSDLGYAGGGGDRPLYATHDGGLDRSDDCGISWQPIPGGPRGLNAQQIYDVVGTAWAAHVDYYIGMQDNGACASDDNGRTWFCPIDSDVFFIQAPRQVEGHTDVAVNYVYAAPGEPPNWTRPAHFGEPGVPWCDPEDAPCTCNRDDNPCTAANAPIANSWHVGGGVYIQFGTASAGTGVSLWRRATVDGAWAEIAIPAQLQPDIFRPFFSGPPDNLTVYAANRRADGTLGLVRMRGVGTAASSAEDAGGGILDLGTMCLGQNTFVCPVAVGVDPLDPAHVIVADIGSSEMKVTRNGGTS
jgi:hypothetical protein